MKRTTWKEKLIGRQLPETLSRIEWQSVADSGQEFGPDEMDNEWAWVGVLAAATWKADGRIMH